MRRNANKKWEMSRLCRPKTKWEGRFQHNCFFTRESFSAKYWIACWMSKTKTHISFCNSSPSSFHLLPPLSLFLCSHRAPSIFSISLLTMLKYLKKMMRGCGNEWTSRRRRERERERERMNEKDFFADTHHFLVQIVPSFSPARSLAVCFSRCFCFAFFFSSSSWYFFL